MEVTELSDAKQRARTTWAAGDYPYIAQFIAEMGETTVDRVGVKEGEEVLDVACGAGNATIPAAQRGARVTGLDLTPELLEAGRRNAAEARVEVDWVEGDAEQLPFEDESFDVVLSTVGVMFAPDHKAAAREIARVLRPGGRISIASWKPDGSIGRFFGTTASHMPPPPEGFQPPPLWGTEEHVSELFKGTGISPTFEEAAVTFTYESADEAIERFENNFGPVIIAKRTLEPEGKWEALRADLKAHFAAEIAAGGARGYRGEYLLTLGTKS
jgi:ubiquinone/menaquinone biosynthesis C-methylase UbiE